MLIYFKSRYTILGKVSLRSEPLNVQFDVPQSDSSLVVVKIIPSENEVESMLEFDASEEAWAFLQTGSTKTPPALQDELGGVALKAANATKRVLGLFKYCLHNFDINERPISSKEASWSVDKVDWRVFPQRITGVLDSFRIIPLDQRAASSVQNCLLNGFEPFLALRHLHKARRESIPHYKWIDATVAAELAIKEFLIRFKPEMSTLLLEIPSPPLHKLYGTVLESFGLRRSPKLNAIRKGVEIRNKLVHRPETLNISLDEANNYVNDVELAIHHLIYLLYPDDPDVRFFYYSGNLHDALES